MDTLWGPVVGAARMTSPSLLISQPSHFKDVCTLIKSLINSWTKPLSGNFLLRPLLFSILGLLL